MLGYWREGFDVVYGVRRLRDGEPRLRLAVTNVFYAVLRRMSPIHPPERAADFRLLDRRIVNLLRGMPEPDRYLRGMIWWLGLRQTGSFTTDTPVSVDSASTTSRNCVSWR
jgi:dolichol-phosphate mannosyltransferase